jgi:NAD(P)-dependent dehydrogenase (short-subunit alcohol dehydrogenase family)
LVNNAGQPAPVTSVADLGMAVFDNVMNVNIRGLVTCMKYAVRVMLEPIQRLWIHEQHVDRVNRRSISLIMASRKKAATVRA